MSRITIPDSLVPTFQLTVRARMLDEEGNVLGYYTPLREGTPEEYVRTIGQFTDEEIEAARKSGPGKPLAEILDDLYKRLGR